MKLTPATVAELAAAIEPADTAERRAAYLVGDFPRADRVKDLGKRYRWDLLAATVPPSRVCTLVYDAGATDAHLDTALRRIVPALVDRETITPPAPPARPYASYRSGPYLVHHTPAALAHDGRERVAVMVPTGPPDGTVWQTVAERRAGEGNA